MSVERRQILLVEDKDSLRRMLTAALTGQGYGVTAVGDVAGGRRHLEQSSPDVVLTDLRLPDGTGLDVVDAVAMQRSGVPVVVMTAFGTVQDAVEAMKLGAIDFLEKPVELDDLFALVGSLTALPEAPLIFQPPGDAPPIVGSHPRLRAALRLLQKVAPTDSTVLLTGESGTGKELFARATHALSKRRDGPFVAVNCAAIPETLIENELFGHEKGAFTGASKRQIGLFERAQGGTIFLDEIGELRLEVQGKVLRVLEERTLERVGGSRSIRVNARVVTATNRDLQTMAASGEFRQDLFYRLDVFPIELPALRERRTDLPTLSEHLVARICQRLGYDVPTLPRDLLEHIGSQEWPGNVRQLANFLERAIIVSDGSLRAADLEGMIRPAESIDVETSLRQALIATDGDKKRAALDLGVSYRTLQRRIREFDLEGFPQYRS